MFIISQWHSALFKFTSTSFHPSTQASASTQTHAVSILAVVSMTKARLFTFWKRCSQTTVKRGLRYKWNGSWFNRQRLFGESASSYLNNNVKIIGIRQIEVNLCTILDL